MINGFIAACGLAGGLFIGIIAIYWNLRIRMPTDEEVHQFDNHKMAELALKRANRKGKP